MKRKHAGEADSKVVVIDSDTRDDGEGQKLSKKRKLDTTSERKSSNMSAVTALNGNGYWDVLNAILTASKLDSTKVRASNPSPEPDNSSHERMAPIEKLPTEILQQILGQLNARSFFSAKLSSPWLWAASKDSYGDDLVDTKTMKRFTKGRCFAQLEARLSASRPGRLAKKLTCSGCCRLCGNNAKGFSDDEFSLSDSTRKCIECLYKAKKLVAQSKTLPTQFKIKGISMFYCHTCGVVDKVENGMSERLTRAYLSKVWLPFGLNKVPGTLSSSGQWIESKDMPRQTSAHFIEEMSEFKPICRTCIIDGHSKVEVAIKDAQRSVEDIIKRVYGEQKPLAFLLGLKKRKSTF